MTVPLRLPAADGQMILVPFMLFVLHELVPELFSKRSFHERIGDESLYGFLERLGKKFDSPIAAFRFRDRIEIVLVRFAGVDLLTNPIEAGRKSECGGEIRIDGPVGITRLAAPSAARDTNRIGSVIGSV